MFVFNGRMFKSKEDAKFKELQNFINTVIERTSALTIQIPRGLPKLFVMES